MEQSMIRKFARMGRARNIGAHPSVRAAWKRRTVKLGRRLARQACEARA